MGRDGGRDTGRDTGREGGRFSDRRPDRGPHPRGAHRHDRPDRPDRSSGPVLPPETDPARRDRAQLLRQFEGTTLTPANFGALKGLTPAALDAQLAQARRERDERRAAAAAAAPTAPTLPGEPSSR